MASCVWSGARLPADFPGHVLNRLAYPVFVKDDAFRFVIVNGALAALVGRDPESILGKTDFDLFPREQAAFFRRKDEEVFARGETVVIDEEAITDAAGTTHVLTTTKVAMRDAAGVVSHLVGVIHDITHLKDVEEALRLAKEELEERVAERTAELKSAQQELLRKERLAVLGQLAAGLAHQIRNPLAAINNAASVLDKRITDDPRGDAKLALTIIREEILAANQIITDLLDYARVRPARPTRVALLELVDAAIDAEALPSGIAVERRLAEGLEVHVDAEQVRHAVRNLIRNALEAMPQGGTLCFSAEPRQDHALVEIRDTGIGIPREMHEHLFDPLVSSKQYGLGLGLSTARALIENQGGTLTCAEGTPKGAAFRLTLPSPPPRLTR
jgi:PAS domain S-box-containing protein